MSSETELKFYRFVLSVVYIQSNLSVCGVKSIILFVIASLELQTNIYFESVYFVDVCSLCLQLRLLEILIIVVEIGECRCFIIV